MRRLLLACFLALSGATLTMASPSKDHKVIDPDDAYKNHCMRCHTALPQSSPRMNKTILLHMKQAAYLPGDEAEAILRYLNGEPSSQVTANHTSPKSK